MSNISLLREKFTIREIGMDSVPVVALGNRLKIDLPKQETPLIIRGHSMHMTLKYGAEIIRQMSYIGHIENVESFFKWENMWQKLIKPFEKDNVSGTWIAIYYKGELIFQYNPHHMFFDVIEQCEYKNFCQSEKYEKSIIMAQNAFDKMGRSVLIEQESHVGFILDDIAKEKRFAIILRIPGQKATFITRMNANKDIKRTPYNYICLNLAADYIEAINMSVRSGFMEKNLEPKSDNMKLYKSLQKRLTQLVLSINQIENQYIVTYRPERPDFKEIQENCAEL